MRLRIPFYMKKRGARRTGARWLGPLGEAVLYSALVIFGAFGLAFMLSGAFVPPWPWLVAVIPASLAVYGSLGLAGLLWESSTSSELRSALAQKAAGLESAIMDVPPLGQYPAVPSIERVIDSPGIQLKYRLPIDASPNWLLSGMTAICVSWNLLVGIFLYQVIELHRSSQPNWLLTWLMVPFVLAGVWTVVALTRQIWMTTGIGTTRLELSQQPLQSGQTVHAYVSQAGRVNLRWLKVEIVCEEKCTYAHGTDTRTDVMRVHRRLLYRARKFSIAPDAPFETKFDVPIPSGCMHSFHSPHNSVSWSIMVRGRVARWPTFERQFPIYVYPLQTTGAPARAARRPVDTEVTA